MEVGDLVRWKPHTYWSCGGLGLVLKVDEKHKEFFAFWFSCVEDYGSWAEAVKAGRWYGCSDLADDIEVLNESR